MWVKSEPTLGVRVWRGHQNSQEGSVLSFQLGNPRAGKSSSSEWNQAIALRAGKRGQRKLKLGEGAPRVPCLKPHSWVLAGSRLNATIPCYLDQRSFQEPPAAWNSLLADFDVGNCRSAASSATYSQCWVGVQIYGLQCGGGLECGVLRNTAATC